MSGVCSHILSEHCGCAAQAAAALSRRADAVGPQIEFVSDAELLARYDSWSSALTGIGERGYDKRQHAEVSVPVLSYETAIALWRSDPMAARAIEMLPNACFARGYDLTVTEGDFDQVFLDEVQDRMEELKIDESVELAYKYERAYGGAAIFMQFDDGGAQDEPLVPAKIRSLDWLTVMEPLEIYPASYYQDPEHPKYGEPEYYRQQAFTVSGAGTVIGVTDRRAPAPTNQLIHESRLVIFGGIRVSRYQRNNSLMGPLWGDSILIRIVEALRDYNIAWGAAGLLPIDFAQSVISVDNLMSLVAKNPERIRDRLRANEMMRSNARAILIDSKEKFQRESTNVTGLPELLDRLSQRMAADVDIPLSMLLGISPSGLGQPGQNDVAMFQDRARSAQRRRLTPPVKFFAKTIMQTMRKRKLPRRWGVEWRNLVHQSDKDVAETRLTQARTDSMYVKMGALKPNEVRESRWRRRYSFETQIDKGEAPGFIAPLPTGVIPKADPAEHAIRSLEMQAEQTAEGAAANGNKGGTLNKPVGPSAHLVGGYARRNPRAPALGAAPKEGGDVEPRNRDAAAHRNADGPGPRRTFAGLPVVVESPRGSLRKWTDVDGREGATKMKHDYGYVEGAQGADGDSVDVYLGPNEKATHAYVVHQNQPPDYVIYDEDKCMIGFDSVHHARDAYLAHRDDDDRACGGITPMTMDEFRTQYLGAGLASLHTTAGNEDALDGDRSARLANWRVEHPDDARTDEEIVGGWGEQETAYEVDRPASKKSEDDPLWNASMQTLRSEDE